MAYKKSNPNGQATMANSEPVVLASDQASIPVTVSGVATAANQTTIIGHVDGIETLLGTMDADTSTLAGAVAGTEMQVDIVGSLPAGSAIIGRFGIDQTTPGTTNLVALSAETTKVIGTIRIASGGVASGSFASGSIASGAIASGAIAAGAIAAGATSIATTEDTASAAADHLVKVAAIRLDTPVANANVSNSGDYTQFALDNKQKLWTADNQIEDGAHATGDRGSFMLGVRVDTPNTASSGADADYTGVAVNKVGSVRTALLEEDFAVVGSNHVKKYYTNSGAVTDGIVWSPAAGKRWYVTDIFINTSAAATITLEDDLTAGDAAVWKAELAANSGWSHHFGTPLFSGEDAADLLITTSAGNCYVTVTGYEI